MKFLIIIGIGRYSFICQDNFNLSHRCTFESFVILRFSICSRRLRSYVVLCEVDARARVLSDDNSTGGLLCCAADDKILWLIQKNFIRPAGDVICEAFFFDNFASKIIPLFYVCMSKMNDLGIKLRPPTS